MELQVIQGDRAPASEGGRLQPGTRVPSTQWIVNGWICGVPSGDRYEVVHRTLERTAWLDVLSGAPEALDRIIEREPVLGDGLVETLDAVRLGPEALALVTPRSDGRLRPGTLDLRATLRVGRALCRSLRTLEAAHRRPTAIDVHHVRVDARLHAIALDPGLEQCLESPLPQALATFLGQLIEEESSALRKALSRPYTSVDAFEVALCSVQVSTQTFELGVPFDLPATTPVDVRAHFDRRGATGRWRWWAAAMLCLLAVAIVVRDAQRSAPPTHDVVPGLERAARDAAARARYVYPPPSEPAAQTAFQAVLELERLEGVGAPSAKVLRGEFAETLTFLGDKYWASPGGRLFALDYYAQALLFDPEHARARERGTLSPAQLARLERRATSSDFTRGELEAVEPLTILAEQDPATRATSAKALLDHATLTPTAQKALATVVGLEASEPAVPRDSRDPDPPTITPDDEAEVITIEDVSSMQPRAVDTARTRRRASTAFSDGRWADARTAWLAALEADPRCAECLMGLSDVAFERARYREAANHARRAVKLAPRVGSYRIRLGDAYRKLLRFGDARAQYERAKALGHRDAQPCLDALDVEVRGK